MVDGLINLVKNTMIVLTVFLFGQWITDGNFEKMVIYLMSGVLVTQYIILDAIRDE